MATLTRRSAKLRKIRPKMASPMITAGQADDDGAAAHIYVRESLILRQESAGEGYQSVGEHQSQNLADICVDALGAGHVGLHPVARRGTAQLSAKNQ